MDILKTHNELLNNIPNLKERSNLVATEDISGIIKNIGSFFNDKLNAISNIFKSNKNRNKELTQNDVNGFVKDLINIDKNINKIKKNVKFSDIEFIEIPVITGLNQDLYVTSKKLNIGLTLVNDNLINILNRVDEEVSLLLSSKDHALSSRPNKNNSDIYKVNRDMVNLINDILNKNSLGDTKKIKHLLPSINAIPDIKNILLQSTHVTTYDNIKKIDYKVNMLYNKIDTLYDEIKNKKIIVMKPRLQDLADILEVSAKIITNSITIMHIYNQTVRTLKYLIDRISK
jgi:hypothetical protein